MPRASTIAAGSGVCVAVISFVASPVNGFKNPPGPAVNPGPPGLLIFVNVIDIPSELPTSCDVNEGNPPMTVPLLMLKKAPLPPPTNRLVLRLTSKSNVFVLLKILKLPPTKFCIKTPPPSGVGGPAAAAPDSEYEPVVDPSPLRKLVNKMFVA